MTRIQRKHSPAFKLKAVMEILKGEKTAIQHHAWAGGYNGPSSSHVQWIKNVQDTGRIIFLVLKF